MSVKFNEEVLINNVIFLLEQKGKNIRDFEREVGVPEGYIFARKEVLKPTPDFMRTCANERVLKEAEIPTVDFVLKAAEALHTSTDILLKINLAEAEDKNRRLISFVNDLLNRTFVKMALWSQTKVDEIGDCIVCALKTGEKVYLKRYGDEEVIPSRRAIWTRRASGRLMCISDGTDDEEVNKAVCDLYGIAHLAAVSPNSMLNFRDYLNSLKCDDVELECEYERNDDDLPF